MEILVQALIVEALLIVIRYAVTEITERDHVNALARAALTTP